MQITQLWYSYTHKFLCHAGDKYDILPLFKNKRCTSTVQVSMKVATPA